MAIYYLDVDDEITSAAARIRGSSDSRIALVLSGGSRVATSRINFRLLAREARARNKHLAIIAADPSVQSVARSAELPVYGSVGEYEKAEDALAGGSAALAGGLAAGPSRGASPVLNGVSWRAAGSGAVDRPSPGQYGYGRPGMTGATRLPDVPAARVVSARRGRLPVPLVAGIALLVVVAAGAGAFFFYPSATVVLTLRQEAVGPMTVSVKIDPSVTAANYQTGTVPGVRKTYTVEASDTFPATGVKVVQTAATGTVTFSSKDTGRSWTISAGTQVTTADGTAFATTARVVVPAAVFDSSKRGTVDAAVTAVKKGVSGNVAAGKIVKMPDISGNGLLSVTNKSPTTGGTHTETPKVQQSDIDAAEVTLRARLEGNFQSAYKAPGAMPSGSSIFAESAQLGLATCSPDPAGLLNQDGATFQLDCHSTGTVTMADMAAVTEVARRRARASVRTGYSLVEESVTTNVGVGSVQGSTLVVPVVVQGVAVVVVDADQLRAGIKGKSLDEARAFLAQYGQATISVSPDWASTMPSFDFRIDIQLVVPSAAASGAPSPGGPTSPTRPAAVPTARPTGVAPASAAPSSSGFVTPTLEVTASPSAPPPTPSDAAPSASPSAS